MQPFYMGQSFLPSVVKTHTCIGGSDDDSVKPIPTKRDSLHLNYSLPMEVL